LRLRIGSRAEATIVLRAHERYTLDMRTAGDFLSGAAGMAVVAMAYIVCHGITTWVIVPVQGYFLSDITIFASLVYLPHGVRVLSTWLLGWRAVLPLAVGAFLAELLFTDADVRIMMEHVLWLSVLVGALSAYVAFEIMRLLGATVYVRGSRMNWRQLLMVGILASVLNSIGQTMLFSGLISPGSQLGVILTYAVGDMLGQAVSMLALMMIFRTLRRPARRG